MSFSERRSAKGLPSVTWTKDQIRRRCLERIKRDREAAVWRKRSSPRSVLHDVCDEVLMTPEDEEELLRELEEELRAFEDECWAATLEAEALAIEAQADDFEENHDDDEVLCPACEAGYLAYGGLPHQRSVIQCRHCGLTLEDGRTSDGLGLCDLRHLLARTFDDHSLSDCDSKLSFYVDPRISPPILMARCTDCGFCAAVM